ncbi:MAG TPA: GNAT family N-acetyltransferase, partial [Anaerolineaceae bacterium]|nr:GNAT family N-acetyltransferase [Anaerolineaceae bacterium]
IKSDHGLIFRGVQGESDYPLLLGIIRSSLQADKNDEIVSLEDIARSYAPSDAMDPTRQIVIASLADAPADAIGYSRLGWYSSRADTRLYFQVSFLRQEFRSSDFWQVMVRQNERRLHEIAREHLAVPQRFYQAWSSDNQVEWAAVLGSAGYQVVRRFNNMRYPLGEVPNRPLPAGFEIRPVRPEHMRKIWEAQKEMNDGLFENVAEDWLEEKYVSWLENPANTPQYWQVAWEGDQLAGMVLAHFDAGENEERKQKLGYTEHIYVRPGWRQRGLASALIARSLRVLKEQGLEEAELGVDSENESAAFRLYQQMGYKTYSVDTWHRKIMEP